MFLFSVRSRPALGPTQSPIRWLPGALSPGVKRQEREADHLPPFCVEIKNDGIKCTLSHMSSWHSAELIKHRDTFTFYIRSYVNRLKKVTKAKLSL
jgi:hypothetical protein